MKPILTALLMVLLTLAFSGVQAQKVKIKNDIVSVDDTELCQLKDDPVGRLSFSLLSLEGAEELYFKWIDYGQFGYFEAYRANNLDDHLFETESITGFRKWIVKQLIASDVLSTNGIDDQKLEVFAKKMGKEFTRKREESKN